MSTTFCWTPRPIRSIWAWAGAILLVVLLSALAEIPYTLTNILLLWFGILLPARLIGRTLVIASNGVLAVVQTNGTVVKHVPLAAAVVKRETGQWRLRWHEGHFYPEVVIPDGPGLADHLEALKDATGPLTEKDAARIVTILPQSIWNDWKLWAIILLCLSGFLLHLTLDQPLFLLGLLALPASNFFSWTRYLVLTSDAFWVVAEGQEPIRVERSEIRLDLSQKRPRLLTPHPEYAVIPLGRFNAADLLNRLRLGN